MQLVVIRLDSYGWLLSHGAGTERHESAEAATYAGLALGHWYVATQQTFRIEVDHCDGDVNEVLMGGDYSDVLDVPVAA